MARRYLIRRRQALVAKGENTLSSDISVQDSFAAVPEKTTADILDQERYQCHEAVFNKYRSDLKRYILKSVGYEDAADDILQDVFVRLIRYQGDIPKSSLKGFLFVTSANLIKDRYRRQKVRLSSVKDPNYSAGLTAGQENPEIIVKHKQSLKLLKEALDDMDQKYHTALTLYRFHNKKHAEIASIMGVTSRSVRNYIREAMVQLTRKLQAES